MASILGLPPAIPARAADGGQPAPDLGASEHQTGANSKNILEHIPFLGGALAALVRPSDKDAEGGDLSDADTRTPGATTPDLDGHAREPVPGAEGEGGPQLSSPQQSPPKAHSAPAQSLLRSRSSSGSDESSQLEAIMLLGYSVEASPSHPSRPPEAEEGAMSAGGWLSRLNFRRRNSNSAQVRAHSSSPPRVSRMRQNEVSVAKRAIEEKGMSEEDMSSVRARENLGDPLALSYHERLQHEKMREDVVRNFAKHIDKLEIGEKFKKATGD